MKKLETIETANNSFVRDDLPAEVEIIGISFRGSTKVYYFAANGNVAKDGNNAIVETARGLEYGKVTLTNTLVKRETLVLPLKNVVRIADKNDDLRYEANREKEKEAFEICAKKIIAHKLDMKLIDVEYTFDNTKLLFYFTSDDRVDFRELVKDLASYFRTRIELRQIGIRDEAKIMGGLGICGRPFCCNTFLPDFVQVSIKMAKEQNLSLNSAKISGACGRLMCCLRYEYDTYQEESRRMPRVDTTLITPDGIGVVTEVKPLQNTVKVILQNDNEKTPRIYHLSVLKPYDPGTQGNAVTPSQQHPTDTTSTTQTDDGKKEQRVKKENQNRNQKPKAPKPVETVGSGNNAQLVADSAPKNDGGSHAQQNKNKNHHNKRRGKANNNTPKVENKPNDPNNKGQQPPKAVQDNLPKSKAPLDSTASPSANPPKAESTDNKRNFAPMPSNSIKRGQGGKFGSVKTRPSTFNKKDNSEKK